MAMRNLLLKPSSMIIAPKPTEQSPSRSKRCFFYTPPTSHRFSSMHASLPISALVKEHKGFSGNMNWGDFLGSSLSSFWDDATQTDEKFLCQWSKEDTTVATRETEDDTQKRKIHKTKRRAASKISRKIYTVIVGASFCAVVAIFSFVLPNQQARRCIVVPYSDLVGNIRDGNVIHVQFVENSREIFYNTKSSTETPQIDSVPKGLLKVFVPKWQFRTRNVGDEKYGLIKLLKDKEVTYGSDPEQLSGSMKNFLFLMLQLAPYWIMVLISCYQLNAQQNLGKMTKRKPSKKQSVTFDDVEGVDSAKAELLEIVSCIKGDSKYMKLGAKLPRGVLLAGPPGTGKTLLARAVAGEADVAFFSIAASELVEVFVGKGAARVRDLFKEARKSSPSIIFIDEIDAVGGQRGRTLNCERDQTLNQLLTEMDGFEKEASVVVIAATNRAESLDSALMRPGRFSRKVVVGVPDEEGRRKIFNLYLREVPLNEDKKVICDLVASLTPGLVGADLENIAHESVLLAARRGGDFVTKDDILEAVERATTKIGNDDDYGNDNYSMAGSGGGSMGFGII
ncbi:probable inactive ATP-dependent zinc metalloprotease FTSHI 3, chloroplastic [Lactuca sativa]|uniref:AAA+ ATPase domain-containing protein n=1 Tax=Lactuca sativa TaxID=4236 RepID=A0A9R1WHA7_LACSA|nr:probable inactive ATP-dependent zinc metalloprotease FTSHI 3, chloroplastic [Lactuca sativa]KAJ0223799.1 hypothetical protein LSAT_V11C200081980 [Lactuca sativa]